MLGGFETLRDFDALGRDPFVVFVEPPTVDTRILNQLSLFSLMSTPTATLDDWLHEHPELWRRVVVPARLKWEIRDKLDQANINERVLFPGLDGISRWLARYYTPTGGQRTLPKRRNSAVERPPEGDGVRKPRRTAAPARRTRP
jgi:hypothetical protein